MWRMFRHTDNSRSALEQTIQMKEYSSVSLRRRTSSKTRSRRAALIEIAIT